MKRKVDVTMKVIRDDEWRLLGFDKGFKADGAFVFEHKKFGDIMILQRVKFIIKELNVVLFFDALADKMISVSNQCRTRVKDAFPSLTRAIYDTDDLFDTIAQLRGVLQAAEM